ncbi:hypothetical protein [Streptomyces bluensis]|uniref:hypothetical protein n=1 Tax=Streptomyces bluensis TaxID=33897 RepID=UPI0016746DF8|nr:hypothetical protein [Streptomyces bluensis]GGZ61607.1 hypothetical protein GCM10010344_29770 [Streptomyces bluensis]
MDIGELTAYEEGWMRILEELQESPGTQVLNEIVGEVEASADASSFDDLEEWEGIRLAPSYHDDFIRFEMLGSQWQTVPPFTFAAGEFRLTPLPLAVHEDPPDFSSSLYSDEDREMGEQLRIIDEHPFTGSGFFVALRLQPGIEDPEVWLSDNTGLWKMGLDYRQYLEALRLTKGAFGWQHLFTEAPVGSEQFETIANQLHSMLDVLPELFPDHDYTDLKTRLRERT